MNVDFFTKNSVFLKITSCLPQEESGVTMCLNQNLQKE